MRRRPVLLLLLVALLAGCGAATPGTFQGLPPRVTPPAGTDPDTPPDVPVASVRAHLAELERIARENGGNRAAGTTGYEASVRYVKAKLDAAGFRTRLQAVSLDRAIEGTQDAPIHNLVADWPGGEERRTLVVGAHLDSVRRGPGINDNGSGSAAILEVALALARSGFTPTQHLRFVWWGAEELGLVGSEQYVRTLPAAEREAIAGYLNFDMVGSPNAAYFVYDGDDSDRTGAGPGPEGSARIEQVLTRAFADRKVRVRGTDFDGRSDYGPFIAVGIPAGGIFTGAEGVKTADEAAVWGGRAGEPYDRCYHAECDTTRNIDGTALDRNTDVIAVAVWELSR